MDINTTNFSVNHQKSVARELRGKDELPFTDVLPQTMLEQHLESFEFRNRIYTPDLIVFGFLSQAMNPDPSCQAAVSKMIAHLIAQGSSAPSANTAAYSKARARLPESVLSGLARESAEQLAIEVPDA
jgi:hypothetical protein